MTLLVADISEFQGDVDMDAYAEENPAIIIRAHNTNRPDNKWVRNIVAANANPKIRLVAAYQYLVGTADPSAAARAFAQTIAPYHVDVVIVDIEEGSGDQQPRQHAWLDTLVGHPEWTYSGDYFARTHGLSVEWIAAYQINAPTTAHKLWQYTDKQRFAGIANPCDGSVFAGSIDDLISLTSGNPSTPKDDTMNFHYFQAGVGDGRVFLCNLATEPRHVVLFRDAEFWADKEGHTILKEGSALLGPDGNQEQRKGEILDAKGRDMFRIPSK